MQISKPWTLLSISDFEKSKKFYTGILNQKILMEVEGKHLTFEDGLALQKGYEDIVSGTSDFAQEPTGATIEIATKPNNMQIAFEVDDLDAWVAKIKAQDGIEILHDVHKYLWGQRVFRFYDYDKHIIEIAEAEHLWEP